jgi:hypothetical protein
VPYQNIKVLNGKDMEIKGHFDVSMVEGDVVQQS